METFWSADYGDNVFNFLGLSHIVPLLSMIVIMIGIYLFRNNLRKAKNDKVARWILGGILLASEVLYNVWAITNNNWTLAESLPLQLCSFSLYMCIYCLLTNSYKVYQIVFFTGLAGASQALFTPDLFFDFPHIRYTVYMTSHMFIIITCWYLTVVNRYEPTYKSIGYTFLFLNIMLPIIYFINSVTGGNYMFVSRKPENPSLLDLLGPHPYYLISIEAVAFILFNLLYLPFLIRKIKRERS